jgi:hypothetical protein
MTSLTALDYVRPQCKVSPETATIFTNVRAQKKIITVLTVI